MRTKSGLYFTKSPHCGPNADFADLFLNTAYSDAYLSGQPSIEPNYKQMILGDDELPEGIDEPFLNSLIEGNRLAAVEREMRTINERQARGSVITLPVLLKLYLSILWLWAIFRPDRGPSSTTPWDWSR